jgi:hypothetical protein
MDRLWQFSLSAKASIASDEGNYHYYIVDIQRWEDVIAG